MALPSNNGIEGTIDQEIDVDNKSDNYFTDFVKSVEAVYFWTSGRWDQLEQLDFWPVDLFLFYNC